MFESSSVRIDVAGIPAVDGLSLTSTGGWVLILDAPRALFEATVGFRMVERGQLIVEGRAARDAVKCGIVAAAPLDPPLPARWTVREYMMWSARLAGHANSAARARASQAIDALALTLHADTRLDRAPREARRAVVLGAALATGATTLVVEDPLANLPMPPQAAAQFARAIVGALVEKRVLFFASRMLLASPIALAADEAIFVDARHVIAQGAPAEIAAAERTLGLRVDGNVAAFANALRAEGARLLTASRSKPAHMTVDLCNLATRDLLRIAAATDAVVLELRPLASAFA